MTEPIEDLLERIRSENLNVYRVSPQRLREDVGQESQIAQDYRGRLIYELLQNADDAMSSGESSTAGIAFILDDDSLWVANSGRPLDEADVRGLCGISASSKSGKSEKRRASIGHKGMGFKSVLEISDSPEVYSTTICFRFGPENALQAVQTLVEQNILVAVTRAPVTRFPWPIEDEPILWKELRGRGMRTAFRFPLRSKMSGAQRDGLARALRDLPVTSLVFLKHLSRVEVAIKRSSDSLDFSWMAKRQKVSDAGVTDVSAFSDTGAYRVILTPNRGNPETFLVAHDAEIAIQNHRGGLDEYTWEGVELTEVSVAARMQGTQPIPLDPAWKKLHVFLPTGEPCPYDLLVSGAFGSNLSRQEIRVEADALNYNKLLLRNVARLLRFMLIPRLLSNNATVVDVLKLLDRGTSIGKPCATAAAQILFEEVSLALSDFAFLPQEYGDPITIESCVVPPIVEDSDVGREIRALLPPDASSAQRFFPEMDLCGSDIARVLVDHGATEMTPEDAAEIIAAPDPTRSQMDISGKLFIDPVLRVLERLWQGLRTDGRERLAEAARHQPLFPIGIANSGTASRVAKNELTCFYPPRSLHGTVPLDGLCFLMQEICWGDLTPKERNQALKQEVATWQALFDVQEFKFPAVMRASVLPALELDGDSESRNKRESLHSLERIAAICQLAGRTPNASAPLPYERLGTNRALFNLSRLDVPCRGKIPGEINWIPAYRVYLGSDWVADNSVECILEEGRKLGVKGLPAIDFLVGPDQFVGLLAKYQHLRESLRTDDIDPGTDEVSLDEDEEGALEGDERSRWLKFLQWLGVNQALRPVHFHDVEDRASGWLTTSKLQQPDGWAFKNVGSSFWANYVSRLHHSLTESGVDEGATLYFYRLHDLEHLLTFLNAASQDSTASLGRALYEHLARNWATLERFSRTSVAQIPAGSVPAMRTKPPRARDEELIDAGPDFWMSRLQHTAFCPTGHGPRRADQTWLPTLEVERRFGRRARTGSYLLPALDVDRTLLRGKAKGIASALGIREELSPATFAPEDARVLLERLRDLYSKGFDEQEDLRQELREVIRPAYRNLFELLSGRDQPADGTTPLLTAPLLAHDGKMGFRFFEDRQFYYIDRRDTRERLQSDAEIWSFVIEALPAARSPMVQLFGVRVLEDTLQWFPKPGDPSLESEDLKPFKENLRLLAPYLLARIAVDRTDDKLAKIDAQKLRRFIDCIEPVSFLELGCELNGQIINLGGVSRDTFVAFDSDRPCQAFVVWGDRPWPPEPQETEALANALCDVFGSGYFEPFLALIQAKTPEDCERLLRRAGASLDIDEKRALFLEREVEGGSAESSLNTSEEPKTAIATGTKEVPASFPEGGSQQNNLVDIRRIPLFSIDQLFIEGEPIALEGSKSKQAVANGKSNNNSGAGESSDASRGGYGGHTNLDALNRVGMWVALSFERNRLRRSGLHNAELFDPNESAKQPDALVFDVSTPDKIIRAGEVSEVFKTFISLLNKNYGVSLEWPGFDLLSIDPRDATKNRLIELKSSGVASRIQEMSWNEWKTAASSALGDGFYLYLVGNLRSDIKGATPFVRTIRNPFKQLVADIRVGHNVSRKVQLAVHLFKEAEHLNLSVR